MVYCGSTRTPAILYCTGSCSTGTVQYLHCRRRNIKMSGTSRRMSTQFQYQAVCLEPDILGSVPNSTVKDTSWRTMTSRHSVRKRPEERGTFCLLRSVSKTTRTAFVRVILVSMQAHRIKTSLFTITRRRTKFSTCNPNQNHCARTKRRRHHILKDKSPPTLPLHTITIYSTLP
jgi:hypothetical protein